MFRYKVRHFPPFNCKAKYKNTYSLYLIAILNKVK